MLGFRLVAPGRGLRAGSRVSEEESSVRPERWQHFGKIFLFDPIRKVGCKHALNLSCKRPGGRGHSQAGPGRHRCQRYSRK